MLKFVLRVLRFSGKYAPRLKASFLLSFIDGIISSVPIVLIWQVIDRVLKKTLVHKDIYLFAFLLVLSLILRMVLRYWFVSLESGTGYELCERERISLGDKLRRLPMRFFSEGNLGHVTSVITVDLPFIEEMGMDALDKVIGGFATSLIGMAMLFLVDWRLALISVAVFIAAILLLGALERVSKRQSPIRQRQQAELVSAILEYVQGISVIKSFNMSGERANRIKAAIDSTKDHSIDFEVSLLKPTLFYKICFAVGISLTILVAAFLAIGGELSLSFAIAMFIFIFTIYTPAMGFASLSSQLRIMEAGLDRYEALNNLEETEESTEKTSVTSYDITFENVSFSYDEEKILEQISFTAKERSVTALVGPSGGGKTTIANLIMRFWDVGEGSVSIGGTDIRQMNSADLLSKISVVFQDVHLFNDTIENNIRFGKPAATKEEIVEASCKAKCHDFIMSLPKGYDTVVGENGSLLSGGERQRVSIARAMLKDAPIIILDEATASVDPDNEIDIQHAIGALIQDKTLIMIAHRLSTIQYADQILVIENKHISERGTHKELLEKHGRYASLWQKRQKASGWQIKSKNN
jgi:ATP-binding cassette subfamily B protein